MNARFAAAVGVLGVALPLAVASAGIADASATQAAAIARSTHTLTVRVIGRGGPVTTTDIDAVSLPGGRVGVQLTPGEHRRLPSATYNVAAWIVSGSGTNQTYTLADQIVNLNRNRTVTLDARPGRRVRVSLDNSRAVAELLEVAPIVSGQWAFNPTVISPPVGRTYLVPMRSKRMTLYVYSVWEQRGNTVADPSPFRYDIVRVFHGAIPTAPLISTRTSQLTRADLTVRAVDADQTATLSLSPFNGHTTVPLNATSALGLTPAHLVSYRTPGYQWQPLVEWDWAASQQLALRDNDLHQPAYRRGRYTELWGAAVWSPAPGGVYGQLDARHLSAGLVGSDFPVGDALHPTDEGSGVSTVLKLYAGGKLLAHSSGNVTVKIPDYRRTYTLTMSTTRSPGALLSTQIRGVWRFQAKGSSLDASVPVQVYSLQILPAGLDLRNRAGSGSRTPIAVRVYSGITSLRVQVPIVRAWASANDGSTWQRLSIRKLAGHYVLSVRNAKAAGFTSLRIYVSDGHGNSEQLTVIHAYGVR